MQYYSGPPNKPHPKKPPTYLLLPGLVKRVTEKAVLVAHMDARGTLREHWVPRSQARGGDNLIIGDTVAVTEWWANKEGLMIQPKPPLHY